METGILLLVCIAILTASGTLRHFCAEFGYLRTNIFMFCLTLISLNIFRIPIIPELNLNPATISLIILLTFSTIKRHEYAFFRFCAAMLLTSVLMLPGGIFLPGGSKAIGLFGFIPPIICGTKRLSLSMLCSTLSVAVAYTVSIVLSTAYTGGIYIIFDSENMLNSQITAITATGITCYATSAVQMLRTLPHRTH